MYTSQNNLDVKIRFEYKLKIDESEKAWRLIFSNGFVEWFPKSKCILHKKYIYVPKWLVLKKGMSKKLKEKHIDINEIKQKFTAKHVKIISSLGKRIIEI